ncbi:MAG: FMN-binding negative transcriptional regulator [Chitinophagaceae bacterium]|nr:FMN-binding negative transcriptional regulator [Chitinophagaceae bacterium]
MYSLPYYTESDQELVLAFMRQHPFVFLAGSDADSKPVASQVPVFIDEREGKLFLSGHIMRKTDHHTAFIHNPHVLAVFTGPHTYVSASLYTEQQTASTWNYMSVHVKGILSFTGEQELLDILKRTTNHFENDPHSPSLFEKLPADYVQKMVGAIVAFEIEVLSIDNVFKLSQNRDEKSYHSIINKLEQSDEDSRQIAEEMKKRTSQLFKAEANRS